MGKLKVVGWTDWDSTYPTIDFRNYEQQEVIEAVMDAVMDEGLLFTGLTHQNNAHGVPVFDNGTCLRCSMRAWGALMAGFYAEDDYMNYYMETEYNEVTSEKNPDVPPNEEEFNNGALPMLIPPDQQVMSQALSFGVEFVTSDKAIRIFWPLYKRRFGSR